MKERVFIIIDGSNFYHRLKEISLKNLLNFDYEKFSQFLAREREVVLKKREEASPKLYAALKTLFNKYNIKGRVRFNLQVELYLGQPN